MENLLTHLPANQSLCRKEVLFHLKWSRTTLWRRERDGLRFADGTIEVRELDAWLDHWARGAELREALPGLG